MCPGNKLWEQSVNDRVKKLMITSNIQGAIGVQEKVQSGCEQRVTSSEVIAKPLLWQPNYNIRQINNYGAFKKYDSIINKLQASERLKSVAFLHRKILAGPAQKSGLVIQDGYSCFMYKGARTSYCLVLLSVFGPLQPLYKLYYSNPTTSHLMATALTKLPPMY